MTQQTKEQKTQNERVQKKYTEEQVDNLLKKQIELCKKEIDRDNLSQVTARKRMDNVKLANEAD